MILRIQGLFIAVLYSSAVNLACSKQFLGNAGTRVAGFGSRSNNRRPGDRTAVKDNIHESNIKSDYPLQLCVTEKGFFVRCNSNNETIQISSNGNDHCNHQFVTSITSTNTTSDSETLKQTRKRLKRKQLSSLAGVYSIHDRVVRPDENQVDFITHNVLGLYGVYQLPSGPQLWVWIAESEVVYEAPRLAISSNSSWWTMQRVTRFEIAMVPTSATPITHEEARQVALLRRALKQHDWYFCSNNTTCTGSIATNNSTTATTSTRITDITHNLQTSCMQRNNHTRSQEDDRFFWNQAVLEPLVQAATGNNATRALLQYAIPVTSAFVGVQTNVSIGNTNSSIYYDQLLISRRSRFRVGTRFTKRGADQTGHVANYAESEQLLLVRNNNNNTLAAVCSHVQTRGSIPLRWSSPTDVKTYRPRVRIGADPLAQARAVREHVLDQSNRYVLRSGDSATKQYPSLLFVNLVDKKSDQGRLGRAFDAVLKAVLDVYKDATDLPWFNPRAIQHIWFDFHAELKGGRWDKLQNLLDECRGPLVEQNYFRAVPTEDSSFIVERLQTGVVRTNCMDCLDRTNVVQSMFGRFMLFTQLNDFNKNDLTFAQKTAFRRNFLTLPWESGEQAHRLLWADNADAISGLYAGTRALKGDFTRTGQRTKKGALDDGLNSLQRYYLNNFMDADRQEGMDLLVGYQPFGAFLFANDADIDKEASSLPFGGISLQEAVRQSLLGNRIQGLYDDGDERKHVRMKQSDQLRGNRNYRAIDSNVAGGATSRRFLNLRWLPGDLQSQFLSRTTPYSAVNDRDIFSTEAALEAIDQRASSDLPWWVLAESSDGEQGAVSTKVTNRATNAAGYTLLGALVLGYQSPFAVAAAVLALMTATFPLGENC
jgi:hypothetical protein